MDYLKNRYIMEQNWMSITVKKKDSPSEKIIVFCIFHIQATSQQTLEFSPRLIKVGYFVVFGYWSKTRQITLEFGFT